jgi:hypothetical protein
MAPMTVLELTRISSATSSTVSGDAVSRAVMSVSRQSTCARHVVTVRISRARAARPAACAPGRAAYGVRLRRPRTPAGRNGPL